MEKMTPIKLNEESEVDTAQPHDFLDLPHPIYISYVREPPSVMKRLVTSVLTYLRLLISLPFWVILLGLGIIAHYAKCLLTKLGITQKLDRLYLNRVKRSWYK